MDIDLIPKWYARGVVGISCMLLSLSWIFGMMRVYVRVHILRTFGWDDGFLLLTLASYTVQIAIVLVICKLGVETAPLGITWISKLLEYLMLAAVFYICTSILLKISLAAFFLRITVERWQRWVLYISVSIYTLVTFVFFFITLFQCGNPIHYVATALQGHCTHSQTYFTPLTFATGTLNAVVDWIFAITPVLSVIRLRLPRKTKATACFLLCLGILGSVASVVRLAFLGKDNSEITPAFLWNASKILLASVVELGLGIIAMSLAALRPLFKSFLEKCERDQGSIEEVFEPMQSDCTLKRPILDERAQSTASDPSN